MHESVEKPETMTSNGTYVMSEVVNEMERIVGRINEKQRQLFLPSMVYLLIVMVLGTVGNLLVLYVFIVKRKSKSIPSYFIKCLSTVDLTVCAVMVPIQIYLCMDYYSMRVEIKTVCSVTRWLMYGSVSASCLVLTYVAYDRYIAICRPLQWYTKNKWRTKVLASLAVFVGFASQLSQFAVPEMNNISFNKVTSVDAYKMKLNFSEHVTNKTEIFVCEHLYEYENYGYMTFILVALVIFLLVSLFMTISYCLIWRQVRHRRLAWKEKQLSVSGTSLSTRKTSTTSFDSCDLRRSSLTSRQGVYNINESPQQRRSGLFTVQLKHQEVICHLMRQSRQSFDDSDIPAQPKNHDTRRVSISDNIDVLNQTCEIELNEQEGIRQTTSSPDIPLDRKRSSIESLKISDLRDSSTRRNSESARKSSIVSFQQNIKMVRIFMCVTIILVLTWTPFWILKLCSIIIDDFIVYQTETMSMMMYLLNYLFYMNSAINPIVYIILQKQFRDDCIDIFCCAFKLRR
ncbi:uncharacterized protein LOC141915430 [Tubulanus polymorphus]|uniref:uncharacterized protein LOC141915430 n=1 Tax=Tubulanus polymorphus TaxID=672921 RepID=UPI003DA683DF